MSSFKFCPKCSGLLKKQTNNHSICQQCGYNFYINPIPCNAALLINPKKEILLVKRKVAPFKDYWDLPGGFVEPLENTEESLTRELKEEIGLTIKEFQYLASFHDRYLYKGTNYYTLGIVFTRKIGDEKITVADDISGFEFFAVDKIPWKKLAFNNVKAALEEYLFKKRYEK